MNLIYSHICAAAENNTIGLKGKLPWNIPEDLQFFKEKTQRKILIMGRKTFESLGTPLPYRLNIVITRNKDFQSKIHGSIRLDDTSRISKEEIKTLTTVKKSSPVVICPSVKEAMNLCRQNEIHQQYGKEIFIIGGGEIYKQTLPLVHCIYLTRIHQTYEGDAFYPEIPDKDFQEVDRKDCKGNPSYSFITYKRV